MENPDMHRSPHPQVACARCGFPTTHLPSPWQIMDKSPPAHLSSTNNVPSNAEAFHSREEIREGLGQLSNIDREIDRLQKAIEALCGEREHIIDHIEKHRAVLLPLRRLPPEIMHEIFSWTLSDPGPTIPPCNIKSPWNLSQVCGRWRAIALSQPSLWSNIAIENGRRSTYTRDALHAQLERSGPCLLTISLPSKTSDVEALSLLVEHSSRWRTLKLVHFSAAMIQLLNGISGRLVEMRTLRVGRGSDLADHGACWVFKTAPKLSEVIITGTHRRSPQLPLPWERLTRLRIGIYAASWLSLAQNLRELTIDSQPRKPPSPVKLSALRTLKVQNGSFLDSLVLPALQDLFIVNNCLPAIPIIQRSHCRLRKLGLKNCSSEEGLAILEGVPTLFELRWPTSSAVLSRMIIPAQPVPDFLPVATELRSMTLYQPEPLEDGSRSILVELMQSRARDAAYPTLSLCVLEYYSDRMTAATRKMRKTLRRQGMDVEYLTGDSAERRYADSSEDYP
ncbi:hypothetical protein B0H11DRAFT_1952612 [Mycena galericulata]|nr:hypothetical protein B0H11DRAFT_1952612 [Mycena galericulata]